MKVQDIMKVEENEGQFVERLNKHPRLRERVESLLNIVENKGGDCIKADDAERYVIDELRKMGSDSLHSWAEGAAKKATEERRKQEPKLRGNGKKSLLADDIRKNRGF